MSCEYTCNGCGAKHPAQYYYNVFGWFKPFAWWQRQTAEGPKDACSDECRDKVDAVTPETVWTGSWLQL